MRDTLTNETNSQIKKYAFIDALRGWAILAVVFFHTAVVVAPGSNLLTMVKEQGARGVQLFYIASALTIFLSMRGRAGEDDATRKFFIRRFFRIAPLFYLAMIAYLIGYGFGPRAGAPYGLNGWHILWTATFLNGWHPEMINSVVPVGWSIAVEMTFYLFAPLLFARIKNIRHALLLVLVALILMKLLRDLLFLRYPPFTLNTSTSCACIFICGSSRNCLSLLWASWSTRPSLKPPRSLTVLSDGPCCS